MKVGLLLDNGLSDSSQKYCIGLYNFKVKEALLKLRKVHKNSSNVEVRKTIVEYPIYRISIYLLWKVLMYGYNDHGKKAYINLSP